MCQCSISAFVSLQYKWQIFVKAHRTTTYYPKPTTMYAENPFPLFFCLHHHSAVFPPLQNINSPKCELTAMEKGSCIIVQKWEITRVATYKRYGSHKMGLLLFFTAERNILNERGENNLFSGRLQCFCSKKNNSFSFFPGSLCVDSHLNGLGSFLSAALPEVFSAAFRASQGQGGVDA